MSHLELDKLTLQPGNYVDERLQRHMSDILYEAPLIPSAEEDEEDSAEKKNSKKLSATIYFLLEHKSTPEDEVPFQLLRYMYERWTADKKDGKPITPIIPIVFYHGERDWEIPSRFLDHFKHVDPEFHAYIPDFHYIFFHTGEQEADEIRTSIKSGSLQACLLLLKYIYDQNLSEKITEVLQPLIRAKHLSREQMLMLLDAAFNYLTGIKHPVEDEVMYEAVEQVFADEGEAWPKTIVERWQEKGIVIGRQQAFEETRPEVEQARLEAERAQIKAGKAQLEAEKAQIKAGKAQLEAEKAQLEIEKIRVEAEKFQREKQRQTVRLILEHRFGLDDQTTTKVMTGLSFVQTEAELDKLTNYALDIVINNIETYISLLPSPGKDISTLTNVDQSQFSTHSTAPGAHGRPFLPNMAI